MFVSITRTGSAAASPALPAVGELASDQALIARIAAGDQLAMRTLFARHKALSARRYRIDAELDEDVAASICDPADDPEISLLKKNRSEFLRQSMANLSGKHREVLDLVYYHGKSVKEVAEITGVAEATVKTRMFHARRKLADLVKAA